MDKSSDSALLLTVSSLRPSAVDDIIPNVSLSDQHFTEWCCSSTLHMDTLLPRGIKALLPFAPVLIPISKSVCMYKPVFLCMFVLACVCVCEGERWWWRWAHPFSLDYSRDFLYDVVKWLWTSTFQSWNLHGDQWALLVSPLGFLFSFHQMAASFFSFLSADFQIAGPIARNSWKLTWVFLN